MCCHTAATFCCCSWPWGVGAAGAMDAMAMGRLLEVTGVARARVETESRGGIVEFGEEFSTEAISGILEPGASDPQMHDFSGTEN